MLGKQLPALPEELKAQAKRLPDAKTASGWDIPWLKTEDAFLWRQRRAHCARPVGGVLTAVEGKTAAELQAQSPLAFLMSWDYVRNLAPHAARG